MFAAFLIMLREGLEAVLVITIIAHFLSKMGQKQLFKPMWIGIATASALCIALGVFIHLAEREFPQSKQELLEGIVGFIAVGVLTWMIFWMRKTGRKIKNHVESKLGEVLDSPSKNAGRVLVSMAFFAVVREGIESVLFLFSAQQSTSAKGLLGGILGLAIAIAIGFIIYSGSRKINVAKLFHWTSIFIIVFAAGLLSGSVRKFTEAGVFSSFQDTAYDFSSTISNDSILGTLLGGLFGYSEAPAWAEVYTFFGFLIPVLTIYFVTNPRNKSHQPHEQTVLTAPEVILGDQ